MVCLISLGKIDKKYFIFPIIPVILLIVQNYLLFIAHKLDNLMRYQFIKIMPKSVGKSLALIIFLLFRKRIRYADKKKEFEDNNNNYNKEYFENILEKVEN